MCFLETFQFRMSLIIFTFYKKLDVNIYLYVNENIRIREIETTRSTYIDTHIIIYNIERHSNVCIFVISVEYINKYGSVEGERLI